MQKKYQQLKTLSNEQMKEITGGTSQSSVLRYKYNCTGITTATWTECIYESVHPGHCPDAVCVPDGICQVYTGYICD